MAHPKIPEAKTDTLELGDSNYPIQELPYTAVLDVVAEGSDIIQAVVSEAAKRGDITSLEWFTTVTDDDGEPVMKAKLDENEQPIINESTGAPVMEPSRQINVELVMGLLFTAVRQLRGKADFFPKLIDSAVIGETSELESFKNLTAGGMLKAVRKVLTLSLGSDSTLGEELAVAFKTTKAKATAAPATGSSTGSSESLTLVPNSSAPPPPQSDSNGVPEAESQSEAASPVSVPLSAPGTPPAT